MCGDVSRWAVPSVSLCACRVCEWSVCLQNIYISRFSLRLALALSNTHTRHTRRLRPALTAHRSHAKRLRPGRPALTALRSHAHTPQTRAEYHLSVSLRLSQYAHDTHKEAAACPHRSPLTHSRFISHFTHFLSLCLQIQRAGAQRKTGSSSLFSSIACNALGST